MDDDRSGPGDHDRIQVLRRIYPSQPGFFDLYSTTGLPKVWRMKTPLFYLIAGVLFFLSAGLLVLGATTVLVESFPEVSQLPSQPRLPDPLVMFNGERVTSKKQWMNKRRPELKALFQHYMYGAMPPAPAKIKSTVERVD